MAIEFFFKMGRGRKEKRSVEESPQGGEAGVRTSLPSVPNQPVNVYSNDQAMKLSAAYRCTSILSGTIASLPLVVKRKKGGYFAPDESNELYPLLTRKPNRRMNAFELVRNMVVQMINRGNAYIVIRRKFGQVCELVLCANDTVAYDALTDIYTICDPYNGLHGRFEAYEVIHLRNNSLDGGYTGVSTIRYASRIFSIAASADNQNLRTFQNGTQIKGIVSGVKGDTKGFSSLSDNQVSQVSKRINEELNSGENIVAVSGDMSFQQLSINPVDAQLIETKRFSVLDICRFYGVHPDKVFAGQTTNYKASEMSQVSFLTDTLQPILRQIEAEFNAKLVADSVASSYKISFDLSYLYQTDLTTKANYYKTMSGIGVYTPNDIRILEGQVPIKGGNTAFVSCNVAPIDSPKIRGDGSTTAAGKEKEGTGKENEGEKAGTSKLEPPKNEDKNIG